jgi:hypothetical protein
MFAREYHIRAKRAGRRKLEGQQLDITFPRRGRPSKHRVLERCGQMQLALTIGVTKVANVPRAQAVEHDKETLDDALQMTFPVRPMSEDELVAEFHRLFD